MIRVLLILFGALLLNSAYLAAWPSPSLFFYGNVALHVVLGVATVLFAVPLMIRRSQRLAGPVRAATMLLLASGGVGVWLAAVGASRAHERVLNTHGALAAMGVIVLATWLDGLRATAGGWLSRRGTVTAGVVFLSLAVGAPVILR